MASLGDLLAKDGFSRAKSKKSSKDSPASQASSLPLYSSSSQESRRERARSDAFSTRSQSAVSSKSAQDRDEYLRRSLLRKKSSLGRYRRENFPEIRGFDVERCDDESQEIEEETYDRYRVSYPESAKELDEEDIEYSQRFQKSESYNLRRNDLYEEDQDNESENTTVVSELKMDELAVKAIISILTRYIKRFFKDENFRASLCRSCASCLGTSSAREGDHKEDRLVTNLNEAIRVVERTVKGSPTPQELKRASVQLTVVTGLNPEEFNDGFTLGIPNLHLVACAHLYLSVIYKFQNKDKASAKHILQVFCNSPNLARNKLLPSLWGRLFLPHLSHLNDWYNNEARFIGKTMSRMKKMKLLEEVYNNILDVGTSQIGVYYRDWLTGGNETPEFPCIVAPQSSFMESSIEVSCSVGSSDFSSPRSCSSSSRPVVSRKLYDSVIRHSKKIGREYQMKELEEEMAKEQYVVGSNIKNQRLDAGIVTEAYLPNVGYDWQENCYASSPGVIPSSDDINGLDEWKAKGKTGSIRSNLSGFQHESENIQTLHVNAGRIHSSSLCVVNEENELTLKKLAAAAFSLPATDHQYNIDNMSHEERFANAKSKLKMTAVAPSNSDMNTPVLNPRLQPSGSCCEQIDRGSLFSSIPKDYVCPLTGKLFNDPVTLETGQTYERLAIKEWFDQGNKTCPVTKRTLRSLALPVQSFVLKRVIDGWISENCKNLLFLAMQITRNGSEIQEYRSKDESALVIIEQLLTCFSVEEQVENARHLVSVGGLQFLVKMLELRDLEEKTRVVSLLLCCIKSDGSCRSYLAMNIGMTCILELLHCEQVSSRANAVALLIELICVSKTTVSNVFINGMQTEEIRNTMQVLLAYLQSVPPGERVLVAVLLLHIDITVEPRTYSIYREAAVDNITLALELCLSDTEIIPNTRRALLMLAGRFSFHGELLTETWLLKQAGFYDNHDGKVDETAIEEEDEEEAKAKEDWLKDVTLILLSSGKKSFLDALSMCLGCENTELVRLCLITVGWLSQALASLSFTEFHLSVFSALIPGLKESLESSHHIEHRVLASVSLLNFSKIPECMVLLKTMEDEMQKPLESLVKVTWIAEHLYVAIFGNGQESAGNEGEGGS